MNYSNRKDNNNDLRVDCENQHELMWTTTN